LDALCSRKGEIFNPDMYIEVFFFSSSSDSEEEYEADEEDAQEVGYASEPAVGLSDVSIPSCYTWHQKYTTEVPDLNM
jgi:hypothetical protein